MEFKIQNGTEHIQKSVPLFLGSIRPLLDEIGRLHWLGRVGEVSTFPVQENSGNSIKIAPAHILHDYGR